MTIGFGAFAFATAAAALAAARRSARVGIGIGIADDERQALRIGRPFVALQAALDVGELKGFAAAADRAATPGCPSPCPGRDEVNDRYLPSGLQRGVDSLSGLDVICRSLLAVEADRPDVGVAACPP